MQSVVQGNALELSYCLIGTAGDAGVFEHALDPVRSPGVRLHKESCADARKLQEIHRVVTNHRQIHRLAGDLCIAPVKSRNIAHIFIGVAPTKAGEIPVRVADIRNLEIQQRKDLTAGRHELARIAGNETGLCPVLRHVAAQPVLQKFKGWINLPHLGAHTVHELRGVQGDLRCALRGVR